MAIQRRRLARDFIERVGLSGFEEHYPHELSGGMRQRANIIRTLIYDPELILMDEPFGPLDAQTRIVLQDQLLKLWSASKKTIIFITHDLIEAIALADRVVLMSSRPGRIKFIEPVNIPRPRDVFQIHDSPEFHSVLREIVAGTAPGSQIDRSVERRLSMKRVQPDLLAVCWLRRLASLLPASAQAPRKVKMTIPVVAHSMTPVYLAQSQGFFRR